MIPTATMINGKPAQWTTVILDLWNARVMPRIMDGETCERANYYMPRPYVNEYDSGSNKAGFVYTVNPGRRVASVQWSEVR